MAVVVVAVAITLVEPLLVVAHELVVQNDALDSRAALLQTLRLAFERAIDLNVVFELPLAFDARVEGSGGLPCRGHGGSRAGCGLPSSERQRSRASLAHGSSRRASAREDVEGRLIARIFGADALGCP